MHLVVLNRTGIIHYDAWQEDLLFNSFDRPLNRKDSSSLKHSAYFLETFFGDADLLPLWVADMDFRSPRPVIRALKKQAASGHFGYSTIKAADTALDEALKWQLGYSGSVLRKEWAVMSPGIVNALNAAVEAYTEAGDGVLIQEPVYSPFRSVVEKAGRRVANAPLLRVEREGRPYYHMDFGALEAAACQDRVKLALLCSPHNPVGRVWSAEELAEYGRICSENGVMVLSDEIHGDLTFPGCPMVSFSSLKDIGPENWLLATAPSKTFNVPGLNTAVVWIPDEQRRRAFQKAQQRLTSAHENPFGLAAMEAAYRSGRPWLNRLNRYLLDNYRLLEQRLPEDFGLTVSEGTYLAWIDVTVLGDLPDAKEFFLKKCRLAVQGGEMFGAGGKGFARLNFALPRKQLERVLDTISFHYLQK